MTPLFQKKHQISIFGEILVQHDLFSFTLLFYAKEKHQIIILWRFSSKMMSREKRERKNIGGKKIERKKIETKTAERKKRQRKSGGRYFRGLLHPRLGYNSWLRKQQFLARQTWNLLLGDRAIQSEHLHRHSEMRGSELQRFSTNPNCQSASASISTHICGVDMFMFKKEFSRVDKAGWRDKYKDSSGTPICKSLSLSLSIYNIV